MKYYLTVVAMMLSFSSYALDCSLSIPVATKHIEYGAHIKYNENNTGLGVECSTTDYTVGFTNATNSYSNNSNYLYGLKTLRSYKGVDFSAGFTYIMGYPELTDITYESTTRNFITPVLSFKHKYFRLTTTYPFAKMFGDDKGGTVANNDVISVSVTVKF